MEFIAELAKEYNFPEWAIISAGVALFLMVIFIIVLIVKILEPKHKQYKSDMFHGMIWKWQYKGDRIIDLWCYCPTCKTMLSVDDENCRTTTNLGDKVSFFICHECGEKEIGRIRGGDRHFALKTVIRDILAKIRLNTFDINAYRV